MLICQSCGMNIDEDKQKGTNTDGGLSNEYCLHCFQKGAFTENRTMSEMIESNLRFLDEWNEAQGTNFTVEEAREELNKFIPTLKRWHCTCTDACAGGYNPNCTCTSSECRCKEDIPDRDVKKEKIFKRLRTLGIDELATLDTLNELSGAYINMDCKLPNGETRKLLNDNKKYFANQVEKIGTDKCYGIASDGEQIAVYQYGCNGIDSELVAWVKL